MDKPLNTSLLFFWLFARSVVPLRVKVMLGGDIIFCILFIMLFLCYDLALLMTCTAILAEHR